MSNTSALVQTVACHQSTALTHCGLVTPYAVRALVQHWLRLQLVAWRYQVNTWNNVDLPSMRSFGIYSRIIFEYSRYQSSRNHSHISQGKKSINSLSPGKFEWKFPQVIFRLINSVIEGWGISCEIAIRWKSLDLTDDKSTLVMIMAWCSQATSHYLNQCWPRSMLPYGITKPWWVHSFRPSDAYMHWWPMPTFVQIMACCLNGTKPPIIWTNAGILLIGPLAGVYTKFYGRLSEEPFP